MFGGLVFMVKGHMCCGISGDELFLRIGPAQAQRAVGDGCARLFDFTGKPMKSMVLVDPTNVRGDDELAVWVQKAVAFACSQPPKRQRS